MKKSLYFKYFIFYLFLFTISLTNISYSVQLEDNESFEYSEIEKTIEASSDVSNYPDTNSIHIIAIDRDTNRILFNKDGFSKTPMASTTKILTAIIAIENCNLNETVNISKNASNTSGSTLGVIENTKMTINDLLYGLMLRSGNDCAVAIAEHIGGTIDGFSIIMNNKAKKLGLKNSNFTSPHGLDDENHYTTAYELALITNYALKNDTFKNIVNTKEINVNVRKSN